MCHVTQKTLETLEYTQTTCISVIYILYMCFSNFRFFYYIKIINRFIFWILSKITDVNYSKLNIENISVGNICDTIDTNTNVKNAFDKIPNNEPTIINNVPFSISILILPAKNKQETSVIER